MGAKGFVDLFNRGKAIPNPSEDFQRLNQKLCLLSADPVFGEPVLRLLGAREEVTRKIRAANAAAVATAIRCGVPLVEFTEMMEAIVSRHPRHWQWNGTAAVPDGLRDLTSFSLCVAHDLALRNVTMAKRFFGTSRLTAERLAELSVANLEILCLKAESLLRLRGGGDLHLWNLLLIGDRCVEESGVLIARRAVQLSMIRRFEMSGASDAVVSEGSTSERR